MRHVIEQVDVRERERERNPKFDLGTNSEEIREHRRAENNMLLRHHHLAMIIRFAVVVNTLEDIKASILTHDCLADEDLREGPRLADTHSAIGIFSTRVRTTGSVVLSALSSSPPSLHVLIG